VCLMPGRASTERYGEICGPFLHLEALGSRQAVVLDVTQ
jgi:hypothetical protein